MRKAFPIPSIDDYVFHPGPALHSDANSCHLIFAQNANDITICGPGTIDGQGEAYWKPINWTRKPEDMWRDVASGHYVATNGNQRPSPMIEFAQCRNVRVSGVTLKNSAGWTMRPIACETVEFTFSGPWEVSFDPEWGGPKKVSFEELVDWTTRSEVGIKYYSGTAIYRKDFDLARVPQASELVLLDLGELHEVGAVRLNGHDLGVLWTRPARVDITDALKATGNVLEITVVNLWPNRLIGDTGLPEKSRFTETNVHKFSSHSPLLASGLLGPVRVLSVEEPGWSAKIREENKQEHGQGLSGCALHAPEFTRNLFR